MKRLFLVLHTCVVLNCFAENLGVVGKIYAIYEPDMIEWIKLKATALVQSGQWQQIQKQAIANAKQQINFPKPVIGITDAQITKNWYYMPVVQMKQDITDMRGHLIVKSGSYNALHYKPFDIQLLFINGNNPKQVKWALSKNAESQIRTKIVLTQGSFIELDKKYKVWFYYDQHGRYTQKLNITHVPAIVRQDGDRLKITEISNKEI